MGLKGYRLWVMGQLDSTRQEPHHGGSRNTHRDANVGELESRGVVHSVSSHSHDLVLLLENPHDVLRVALDTTFQPRYLYLLWSRLRCGEFSFSFTAKIVTHLTTEPGVNRQPPACLCLGSAL
jgi:hypothetical protein